MNCDKISSIKLERIGAISEPRSAELSVVGDKIRCFKYTQEYIPIWISFAVSLINFVQIWLH